ncbi:MAG: patatin-like phospholipase family protein [Kiritimatiellia bacterium]
MRTLLAAVMAVSIVPSLAGKPSERPKVGLVLSGGGAKGFAHIGVLKQLEEMRIPVDYIAGTSMGAIMGGLYASGMSPREMEQAFVRLDWWDILKDQAQRKDLAFRRKKDDQRYLGNLEMGFKHWKFRLPRAMSAGQKLNNHLVTLTRDARKDFDDLNIPFRAIATDLSSGDRVVLGEGSLARVMRASMAIPGVFSPVEIDGVTLIDGGIADNIPVDLVREMGADIIIAVDLGAMDIASTRRSQGDIAEMIAHTYQLIRRPQQEEQMRDADIAVTPDTSAFAASDFYKARVIIGAGRQAARAVEKQLHELSVSPEEYEAWLQRQRRLEDGAVVISSISISGEKNVDERIIARQMRTKINEPLDYEVLEDDLARIHGLGFFESAMYGVGGTSGKDELTIDVSEKPWGPGYVHFGLKLDADSEENSSWSVLANYTRRPLNRLGGEFLLDLQAGETRRIMAEIYQPLDFHGALFFAPATEYSSSMMDVYDGDRKAGEYDVEEFYGALNGGVQIGKYGQIQLGMVAGRASVDVGDSELENLDQDVGGWTGHIILDRRDSDIFAREGFLVMLRGFSGDEALGHEDSYEKISWLSQHYLTWRSHTVFAHLELGTSLDSELPIYDEFALGGLYSMSGYADGQLRGQYMGVGRIGYMYRISQLPPDLGKGVYIGVWSEAGNVWQQEEDVSADDLLYGGTVGVGADTFLGPLYFAYGRSEQGRDRLYFSLGSNF